MSALRYAVVFGASLVLMVCCSCKKSKNEEISSAANNAAASVRYALTNGVDLETSTQRLAQADEAAMATKTAVTNEVFVETGEAGLVLKQLHELGRLPGDSKDEHGKLTSDDLQLVVSDKAVAMVYPATRTFHLVKVGETSTNNYTLMKQSKDAEWKLQKAWLTDSNGQIIQEWPVQ